MEIVKLILSVLLSIYLTGALLVELLVIWFITVSKLEDKISTKEIPEIFISLGIIAVCWPYFLIRYVVGSEVDD